MLPMQRFLPPVYEDGKLPTERDMMIKPQQYHSSEFVVLYLFVRSLTLLTSFR